MPKMSKAKPGNGGEVVVLGKSERRLLTAAEFQGLSDVPPEAEWFANIANLRTRRAYQGDIKEFMVFVGIMGAGEFRLVTRAHALAWRKELEQRGHAAATIRRKLSALASLFDHLCERNAVPFNPLRGVKRPSSDTNEGKTPAIGDGQARALLNAPSADTLKGKRDRAILAVLLYHGLRRAELCALKVGDLEDRRGIKHLRVHGKGSKIRFVPAHPAALARIEEYLDAAGHKEDAEGPLFRPTKNNRNEDGLRAALTPGGRVRGGGLSLRRRRRHQRARLWSPCPARHGGHQRVGPRGRHRQGPGVARPRQHRHHPPL